MAIIVVIIITTLIIIIVNKHSLYCTMVIVYNDVLIKINNMNYIKIINIKKRIL